MPELEKVITALQHCIYRPCHINCPYFEPNGKNQAYCLFKKILPDALALLKEQERQLKEWEKYAPFLAAHGVLKEGKKDV